jgi:hypothetical protein
MGRFTDPTSKTGGGRFTDPNPNAKTPKSAIVLAICWCVGAAIYAIYLFVR